MLNDLKAFRRYAWQRNNDLKPVTTREDRLNERSDLITAENILWYYKLTENDEVLGPYNGIAMDLLLQQGTITPATWVRTFDDKCFYPIRVLMACKGGSPRVFLFPELGFRSSFHRAETYVPTLPVRAASTPPSNDSGDSLVPRREVANSAAESKPQDRSDAPIRSTVSGAEEIPTSSGHTNPKINSPDDTSTSNEQPISLQKWKRENLSQAHIDNSAILQARFQSQRPSGSGEERLNKSAPMFKNVQWTLNISAPIPLIVPPPARDVNDGDAEDAKLQAEIFEGARRFAARSNAYPFSKKLLRAKPLASYADGTESGPHGSTSPVRFPRPDGLPIRSIPKRMSDAISETATIGSSTPRSLLAAELDAVETEMNSLINEPFPTAQPSLYPADRTPWQTPVSEQDEQPFTTRDENECVTYHYIYINSNQN